MSTRFVFACGALAAAVALALVAPPATALSPGQAPARPDCTPQNLRASLRPQGPLPAPGEMPAGSTMARIAQRGHLIVGVNRDVQGFTFRDENLRLHGFDIDIARDIAEVIFGDRERVVFRQPNTAERLEMVQAGHVDLVIANVIITCQRRERNDYSAVYFETGHQVLVNRGSGFTGLAGLAGHPVCATRGAVGLEIIQAATPKVVPVGASATTDCLALLQLGKVDAICATGATLSSMVAQDPRTEIVGARLTEDPFGIAISKNAPDLVRFVNAVLERRVQDGRWLASYQRWMTLLGPPPSPPPPQYQD